MRMGSQRRFGDGNRIARRRETAKASIVYISERRPTFRCSTSTTVYCEHIEKVSLIRRSSARFRFPGESAFFNSRKRRNELSSWVSTRKETAESWERKAADDHTAEHKFSMT